MKLFNTLSRKVEEFKPIKKGHVGLYSCGPTVYDHLQIGNLRSFIFADLLQRALRMEGYEVDWIMNITDVDDKTIHRSLKEYPKLEPDQALEKLTRHFEKIFIDDAKAVGIELDRAKLVRATDEIALMQKLIKQIAEAGFAYVADGSIYFDLKKYTEAGHHYGQLSRVDFKPQARINNDEYDKQEARDFVLWKAVDEGEPSWDFEFNRQNLPGRPGWHIECSAMSAYFLAQPFDVHTGGVDLIFPHHENEIAQSTAASNKPLANYFVHNEHLLVDGKKMSKSLNNYFTLQDVVAKDFSPMAFRLLMLSAHYRTQQNFTWDTLAAAQNTLLNLYAWADLTHQAKSHDISFSAITEAIGDDLNMPEALAGLNRLASEGTVPSPAFLKKLDKLFGLGLAGRADITDRQKGLINQREAAREVKDFTEADSIRDQLVKHSLEVEDTSAGPRWRRTKI